MSGGMGYRRAYPLATMEQQENSIEGEGD
jgi:hypothetical protein